MAYCTNCGAPISDGAKFCENCGAPVERPSARTTTPPKPVAPVMPVPQEREDASTLSPTSSESRLAAAQPPAGSSIIQGNDGTFRWVFEYSLWRDVTVFFTVFKISFKPSVFIFFPVKSIFVSSFLIEVLYFLLNSSNNLSLT